MLFTSQSGVGRHIRELEYELGVEIFIRRGKRLIMTESGKTLLSVAERILNETNNIRHIADVFANKDSGELSISTTHTQARYSLPGVIKQFRSVSFIRRCGWCSIRGVRKKSSPCCNPAMPM